MIQELSRRLEDDTFIIVGIVEALQARSVCVDPLAQLLRIICFADDVVIQWTGFDEKVTFALARNVELRVAAFHRTGSIRH